MDSRSTSLEGIGQGGEGTSYLDSDSDDELDLPDWASNVPTDILNKLSSKEKKRQEIINELYHTERSHIRGAIINNTVLFMYDRFIYICRYIYIYIYMFRVESLGACFSSTYERIASITTRSTYIIICQS